MSLSDNLSIFANFFIDTEERFLRVQDSYNSIKNIQYKNFLVNVRGKYAEEVIKFLADQDGFIKCFSINSCSGWFYDSNKLLEFMEDSKYLLLWLEDHICMEPDKINLVVDEMDLSNADILTYSYWQFGKFLNRYSDLNQVDSENITWFDHTIENNHLINNRLKKSYLIAYPSIIKRDFFSRIIKDGGRESRFPKSTPFDFEKAPSDLHWLPLRRANPKYELFCSIDDDHGIAGSSLQLRGLYPKRESRQSYADNPQKRVSRIKSRFLRKIKTAARLVINLITTPPGYKWVYFLSITKFTGFDIKVVIPWMNFYACEFLKSKLRPGLQVFEYGSGQSTKFWIEHQARIISIEHDRSFYNHLRKSITGSVEYKLIEPEIIYGKYMHDPGSSHNFHSSDFKGYSFENYVRAIDAYPNDFFDFVIIDGHARLSCIKNSIPKIKRGGMLVLDNSDRNHYLREGLLYLNGWSVQTFRGNVLGLLHKEQTSFYTKP